MKMGHDAIRVFFGYGSRVHSGKVENIAEDFKILGAWLRLDCEIVDRVLGRFESPVKENRKFMSGQVTPVLGWLVANANADAK